ncbi:hypothetical protein GCM10011571_32790 [Marinithermofilum abyssi]|uniref:Cell surface protein n=1 Tax=Marinithermofilum abyssi TaxID=1571185 RepID=A0A8J2VF56_9BACL|nr:hypothetical protein [Marinithermofilum abyssi]GGE28140.1 hypothetical protein GCM10011571_32790 [Marinithermofilum abyssi]
MKRKLLYNVLTASSLLVFSSGAYQVAYADPGVLPSVGNPSNRPPIGEDLHPGQGNPPVQPGDALHPERPNLPDVPREIPPNNEPAPQPEAPQPPPSQEPKPEPKQPPPPQQDESPSQQPKQEPKQPPEQQPEEQPKEELEQQPVKKPVKEEPKPKQPAPQPKPESPENPAPEPKEKAVRDMPKKSEAVTRVPDEDPYYLADAGSSKQKSEEGEEQKTTKDSDNQPKGEKMAKTGFNPWPFVQMIVGLLGIGGTTWARMRSGSA